MCARTNNSNNKPDKDKNPVQNCQDKFTLLSHIALTLAILLNPSEPCFLVYKVGC